MVARSESAALTTLARAEPAAAARRPRRVLVVFVVVSLLGIAAITLLTGLGVARVYRAHVMRHSEVNAINVGAALFERERPLLTSAGPDGRVTVEVPPDRHAELDAWMSGYLRPLQIVKIKVFAADGRIVYSTDRTIVARVDRDNPKLARALRGETITDVGTRDRIWDLAGEERFDLDIVETYLPIRDGDRIVGAYETYTDITWSRAEVRDLVGRSVGLVLALQLAAFGVLFAVMRRLTGQIAAAQAQLERMATTDGLTGLSTRRHVMARAAEECAKIPRHRDKSPKNGVGFLMVDIDHFKRINDEHGHQAGDEVLRQIGACLRHLTRAYDVAGRYGGEEFLVVLPHADFDDARTVAQRVCEAVRGTGFSVGDRSPRVTVSVGVACATEGDAGVEAALRRADEGLYKAKRDGRDRVAWA